ncbi:unnamed protein product, partial [Didymodactylos carnosus]
YYSNPYIDCAIAQCTTPYNVSVPHSLHAETDPCNGNPPKSVFIYDATTAYCCQDVSNQIAYWIYNTYCNSLAYNCSTDTDCGQDGMCMHNYYSACWKLNTSYCAVKATGLNCGATL